jgi:hypothetical protein
MNRARGYVLPVLLGISLALQPVLLAQEAPVEGNSTLSGKITGSDGKPLPGARVLAYHLSSEDIFSSEPTDSKGEYLIAGLPYGYFDLAVETGDGLFVANQVFNVAPGSKTAISMSLRTLAQAEGTGEAQARVFPGASQEPSGVAAVSEKLTGREFWRSPKGVAIIAGGGALVLLAIASGGSSSSSSPEPEPSPSTP